MGKRFDWQAGSVIQLRLQPGAHSHISRATGLGVHSLSDILTYEGRRESAEDRPVGVACYVHSTGGTASYRRTQ